MSVKPFRLAFVDVTRPLAPAGVVLLAIGLLVLCYALIRAIDTYGDYHLALTRAQEQKRLASRSASPPLAVNAQRQLRERIAAANEYIYALNLPWDRVFRTLLPPAGSKVFLVGIDMSGAGTKGGGATGPELTMRISAEADDADEMTDYISYLLDKPELRNISLVKHEMAKEETAVTSALRFQIEATWTGSY